MVLLEERKKKIINILIRIFRYKRKIKYIKEGGEILKNDKFNNIK